MIKRIYMLAITTALLSSCGVYNKYSRPEVETQGVYGSEAVSPVDSTTLASMSWKELFSDVKLQKLIESGIANNMDMQAAQLRVEETKASLKAAKLSYVPSFALAPQGGVSSFDGSAASYTYQLPLSVSWEVDIFGKVLNAKRQANSAVLQSEEYKRAVQTSVVSTVVNLYYTLLMLDNQVSITEQTVLTWNESLRVMNALKSAGMQNQAGISRAEANIYQIEASLMDLKHKVENVENQLSLVLMQPAQSIERGSIGDQLFPTELAIGYPIQILSNRPDVKSSEYALAQSFYGVNYSRAMMYPSLNLGGTAGWTNSAGAIVNPGKLLLSAVGSLTQPLFQKGALRANLAIAKSRYEASLLSFQQSILRAGVEVNDALRQCQTARNKRDVRAKQIESLNVAMKSTELLMKYGSTTYLEVLTAQQALLQAEVMQVGDWFEEAQGVVNLYHALGGGVN